MIIKSFIYGFEIVFLYQLYPPNYVLLEIPQGYICRWIQCGSFTYLVALEWKRQLHGLDFKNSHEYTTVTCLQ